MSKRLSKRQLREQQELEELGGVKGGGTVETDANAQEKVRPVAEMEEEELENEGDAHIATGKAGGLFSQLGEAEGGEKSCSEEIEGRGEEETIQKKMTTTPKKKKKKKKKPTVIPGSEGANETQVNDVVPEQEKKTKATRAPRKSREQEQKKTTPIKDVSSMSMDEFSALLASQTKLDEKQTDALDSGTSGKLKSTGPLPALRAHLALSAPYLDPSVELKRQFGAAAIKAYENEANSSTGRGGSAASSSSARARATAWNTNFKVRSILVQPQDTWPPIAKTFTGMTMETIEVDQMKMGGWVHSRAYRKAQLQFLQAVQSYEPNHLISLLRLYPWHIDTLLQLSDVSRHQGDLGAASDWNARALFAFERTSTSVFSSSLTSQLGPPLLNFDRIEDRSFWIACHRHINFMGRRGTWRTALEWVKLMFGLDPTNDHHGMILWLDFLSIKSRQHTWFLDCLQKMDAAYSTEMQLQGRYIVNAKTPFDDDKALIGEGKSNGALDWCLGCSYAKALAWRAVEKEQGEKTGDKSTAALRLAISRHPQLLPLLFDKIGLAFPSEMKSSSFFTFDDSQQSSVAKLLAHIYVSRSESLWREAEVGSWLLATLQQAWPTLQRHADDICAPAADERSIMGIYRHVLVSDLPDALRQTLIGLMPKRITSNSAMLNAYDPLPPQGPNVTLYDDEYFEPVTREQRQQESHQHSGLAQAGSVEQFMNAIRGVRGLEGWGTAMEDMDEESRTDAMAQILQMTAEARGQDQGQDGMPGTFHPREQETGQEAGPGAFQALRRLLGNLWGEERIDAEMQRRTEENEEEEEEHGQ